MPGLQAIKLIVANGTTGVSMTVDSEIEAGARFEFGENWARFLSDMSDDRISEAESALLDMLSRPDLKGLSFLDIGSGSGLSSLAARRLGARVYSFDYDTNSVACTRELKRRYFENDDQWKIEEGSALDTDYIESLGKFDIVYSWGVLHHTGSMWVGFENAIKCVSPDAGNLYVAVYNDQGWKSHSWWFIKAFYNRLPSVFRYPFAYLVDVVKNLLVILKYTLKLQPMTAIRPLLRDKRIRGMSAKHDKIDWIGGFPYEFVTIDVLRQYFLARGFAVINEKPNSTLGCHELTLVWKPCAD